MGASRSAERVFAGGTADHGLSNDAASPLSHRSFSSASSCTPPSPTPSRARSASSSSYPLSNTHSRRRLLTALSRGATRLGSTSSYARLPRFSEAKSAKLTLGRSWFCYIAGRARNLRGVEESRVRLH